MEPAAVVEAPPAVLQGPNQHPMKTRAKTGIWKPNTRYALVAAKHSTKTLRL